MQLHRSGKRQRHGRTLRGIGAKPRGSVFPVHGINQRDEDDWHEYKRVMPFGAPIELVVSHETANEDRQREQGPRRGQSEQASNSKRDEDSEQFASRLVEGDIEEATVAADGVGVIPRAAWIEIRDDNENDEGHADQSDNCQNCAASSLTGQAQDDANRGNGQSHVLLDKHQRQRQPDDPAPVTADVGRTGQRQQRRGEGHLVKISCHRRLDAK